MAEQIGSVVTTETVTTREIMSFLYNAEYPASPSGLLNTATMNGANQYIRAAVGELPNAIYESESDVIATLISLGYTNTVGSVV